MKKFLFLLGICSYLAGMEEASNHLYYNKYNLSVIDQFHIQRHTPLMIITDEYNSETVNQKPELLPCTFTLAELINIKTFPILITAHLLSNMLERFEIKQQEKVSRDLSRMAQFNLEEWEIAPINHSRFVLMIPKNFLKIFGKNPGFNKLFFMPNHSPSQHILKKYPKNQYNKKLIELLHEHEITNPLFNIENFKFIFEPNTNIWDIRLLGHGTSTRKPPVIANFTPNQLNSLLSFFDHNLSTGTVYIESCMAGGKNRTLLETNNDGIQLRHNFILIIGSVSNSSISYKPSEIRESLINFFNYAADTRDKGESLNTLLKKVTILSPASDTQHGTQNIPQVWLPGGIGFQTFNIDRSILSLNSILLKKHQEDKSPLIIQNKTAVLVYPEFIDIPITVYPTYKGFTLFKWENFPLIFEPNFLPDSPAEMKRVLSLLEDENIVPEFQLRPNNYQYPQFISMLPEVNNHRFSKITVSTDFEGKKVATGVLQFLRDAFLDMQLTYSDHSFRIDTLTGLNDISVMLAATRILNKTAPHPLETILKKYENKDITLDKVFALYEAATESAIIAFSFENTGWFINVSLTKTQQSEWWNFTPTEGSFERYIQEYNKGLPSFKSLLSPQKSITDVLKQKQIDIAKKRIGEQAEKPRPRL